MKYEIIREDTPKKKLRSRDVLFIVLLVLLTLVLALFVAKYAVERGRAAEAETRYKTATENVYRKSYYALVYNVDSLESALTKLSVAKSTPMRQEYLSDVATYATAASENISNLAERDAENSKMMKFINQTGDYAKYLNEKLARGGALGEEENARLAEITALVRRVKSALAGLSEEVEKGEFVDFLADENSGFSEMIRTFENDDVDYPSMIYDGPFSDSMSEREAKALVGEDVSEEEAKASAKTLLPHANITEISVKNGSKNVFDTYDCEMKTEAGIAYATITKKGGFPVSMNAPREESGEVRLAAEDAESIAEGYLVSLGLEDMRAVWVSLYENVYFVNLAYAQNGVILYPDLIKVKVDASKGEVIGMESLNYIFNHTARTLPEARVTEGEAKDAVSEGISVESVRLVLVPTKGNAEKLAYEVYGTMEDGKYFVYVDAVTGEEIKIMYVVDGERGLLLQ